MPVSGGIRGERKGKKVERSGKERKHRHSVKKGGKLIKYRPPSLNPVSPVWLLVLLLPVSAPCASSVSLSFYCSPLHFQPCADLHSWTVRGPGWRRHERLSGAELVWK